jgi:hypothetical protein
MCDINVHGRNISDWDPIIKRRYKLSPVRDEELNIEPFD